ncbi:MAG: lysophospholipid acyltransferase family protein [Halothiobacillaceae bacterium]
MSQAAETRQTRLANLLLDAFATLPLPLNHALGGLIGRIAAHIPNRLRHVTRQNLALCFPAMSAQERRRLERQSLIETGKTLTEVGPLWRWPRERLLEIVRETPGLELVEQTRAEGHGIILLGPHIGAWELVGLYASIRWPMTSLYKPPKQVALETPMRKARERLGATLVPTDASGVKALLQALKRREVIGILPDQEPTEGQGVFSPFLGQSAYTMVLASRLSGREQARAFFTFAERLPRGRGFRLHFIPAEDDFYSPDLTASTAALNRGVEACIRIAPAQYQWSYKRFRKRPEGMAEVY